MFSLNGTLKKVGRLGDGKRNNLLGWPNLISVSLYRFVYLKIQFLLAHLIQMKVMSKVRNKKKMVCDFFRFQQDHVN